MDAEYGKPKPSKRKKKKISAKPKVLAKKLPSVAQASRSYQAFLALPRDIMTQILIYADPSGLYGLSCTCKYWYNKLWSREQSLAIWQAARASLTFKHKGNLYALPDPPAGLCEASFARVSVYPICMACDKRATPGKYITLLLTLCDDCACELLFTKKLMGRRLASEGKGEPETWMFDICRSYSPRDHKHKVLYSIWELEEVMEAYEDDEEPSDDELSSTRQQRLVVSANLTKLAVELSEWHKYSQQWHQNCLHERATELIRVVEILLEKLLTRFALDEDFEVEYREAIEFYFRNEIAHLSHIEWGEHALNEELPVPESVYKLFLKQIKKDYRSKYEKRRQERQKWHEEASIRALLAPFLDAIRKQSPQLEIWPAEPTLCSFEPCKRILRKMSATTRPETQDIQQWVDDEAEAIVVEVDNYGQRALGDQSRQSLCEWHHCIVCGDSQISLYDLETHVCLNYYANHPKTWQVNPSRSDAVLQVDKNDVFGRVFELSKWGWCSGYNQKVISVVRKVIPTIPHTHRATLTKTYQCQVCKDQGHFQDDHEAASYKTVIKCFMRFQKERPSHFELMHTLYRVTSGWKPTEYHTNYHLDWREIADEEAN